MFTLGESAKAPKEANFTRKKKLKTPPPKKKKKKPSEKYENPLPSVSIFSLAILKFVI